MDKFNTAFSVGDVGMSWNAVMLALGILTAVVVSEILVKRRKAYKDLALDACIIGILTGLLGARLFAAFSGKIAFSEFFLLSRPGLNLPGALLFTGTAIAVYAKIRKLDLRKTFDILLPGAFFGLAVGRWSDFFLCDGLGPVAGAGVPKFFPLVTFTQQYFTDHTTVAYAIFFADFLVCLALGVLALLLSKKLDRGRTARLTIILYLFAEFILEWLRERPEKEIPFGEVRFNQIVLMALLLFFIGLSLYRAKHPGTEEPEPEEGSETASEEPESAEKAEDAADAEPTEAEAPAEEPTESPVETDAEAPDAEGGAGEGGDE